MTVVMLIAVYIEPLSGLCVGEDGLSRVAMATNRRRGQLRDRPARTCLTGGALLRARPCVVTEGA